MEYTEILTSLRKIIRSVNLESKRTEKEYGVSIPQLLCLNFLNEQPQFIASQKKIKDFLSLNASTVTGIIVRLEKKGLIARLPKRDDKRVTFITLTAKGSELLRSKPTLLHEKLSQRLQQLPPEELNAIRSALRKIENLLDSKTDDAAPIITAEIHIREEEETKE